MLQTRQGMIDIKLDMEWKEKQKHSLNNCINDWAYTRPHSNHSRRSLHSCGCVPILMRSESAQHKLQTDYFTMHSH